MSAHRTHCRRTFTAAAQPARRVPALEPGMLAVYSAYLVIIFRLLAVAFHGIDFTNMA